MLMNRPVRTGRRTDRINVQFVHSHNNEFKECSRTRNFIQYYLRIYMWHNGFESGMVKCKTLCLIENYTIY
jgi:hypothetical protein